VPEAPSETKAPEQPKTANTAAAENAAAGPDMRAMDPLNQKLESAIAAGDSAAAGVALDSVEKLFGGQIAARQEELDALYAVPARERTDFQQAKIDGLEYANAIDRKTLDRRRKQLELISLQTELKQTEVEIAKVQTELDAYAGQQTHNLLAANAEEGRVLAKIEPDKKEQLQAQLAGLQATQKELGDKIGATTAQISELAEAIAALDALKGKADIAAQRFEDSEDQKEEKTTTTPGDEEPIGAGGGFGFPGGGASEKPGKEKVQKSAGSGKTMEDRFMGVVGAVHDPVQAAANLASTVFEHGRLSKPNGKKED